MLGQKKRELLKLRLEEMNTCKIISILATDTIEFSSVSQLLETGANQKMYMLVKTQRLAQGNT